jgi:hypothetical protein
MQYLVREIHPKPSFGSGEGRIFKTLPDAVKHLQKVNRSERLYVGEKEGTLDQLERFLSERLATVALRANLEDERQWVITAFE